MIKKQKNSVPRFIRLGTYLNYFIIILGYVKEMITHQNSASYALVRRNIALHAFFRKNSGKIYSQPRVMGRFVDVI